MLLWSLVVLALLIPIKFDNDFLQRNIMSQESLKVQDNSISPLDPLIQLSVRANF